MFNILVADDHAIVRQGLRRILAEIPTVRTIGEAADGDEALRQLRAGAWDVLILDLNMPGRSGVDVLAEIRHSQLPTRVLVLSLHPTDEIALRVLRAGAAGYLPKDQAIDELVAAVSKILAGGTYLSAEVGALLLDQFADWADRPLHHELSDREFQVLRLLAQGQRPSQIAANLNLSPKTISTYRQRLLRKLKLNSNADLVHYAARHGLVDLP